MIKFLAICLIAYIIMKFVRISLRRRFAQYQAGYRPRAQVDAVETVKCPRCNTFVAEGVEHECQPV